MQIRGSIEESKVNYKLAANVFHYCKACAHQREYNDEDMSVPQGAFAAQKVRTNMDRQYYNSKKDGNKEETSRYNSKFMNSIWGMYNRFSVHNLKKVMDDNQPNTKVKGPAASSSLSVSIERLSYLPL